ncbi:hypothetical protein H4R33_000860 [Dimargaris cristalligena]|nr:hypothetical protein H4R33_000860 [Dimargaris cristalligena]
MKITFALLVTLAAAWAHPELYHHNTFPGFRRLDYCPAECTTTIVQTTTETAPPTTVTDTAFVTTTQTQTQTQTQTKTTSVTVTKTKTSSVTVFIPITTTVTWAGETDVDTATDVPTSSTTTTAPAPGPTFADGNHQIYVVIFQGGFSTTQGQTSRANFFDTITSWGLPYEITANYTALTNGVAIDFLNDYYGQASRIPGVASMAPNQVSGSL